MEVRIVDSVDSWWLGISKFQVLVTLILIICVLSFSTPPCLTNTVERTIYYKTQNISLGDGQK